MIYSIIASRHVCWKKYAQVVKMVLIYTEFLGVQIVETFEKAPSSMVDQPS